ncbi:MAG: HNH endonuclease [Taibaiella sp.]|nr:HNH endonuclease [Taibaiella sp.]
MAIIISSGNQDHIRKTVDNDVLGIFRKYREDAEIGEVLKHSNDEGIRCWGLNESSAQNGLYRRIRPGFEVLIKENGTEKFTRYGIVIHKLQSPAFAKELWPDNDRHYIVFLANVRQISIEKNDLIGAEDDLQGMRIKDYSDFPFLNGNSLSVHYQIPVLENIRNIRPQLTYYAANLPSQGTRRQGHQEFAAQIKENYRFECAICGISEPEFLVAAHINRWADDEENRINPRNGICLCSLHDQAFEYGYIGLDAHFKVVLSPRVREGTPLHSMLRVHENTPLKMPVKDLPNSDFLQKHREKFGFELSVLDESPALRGDSSKSER